MLKVGVDNKAPQLLTNAHLVLRLVELLVKAKTAKENLSCTHV